MAKLSSDGLSVTVERGDTLSEIALEYTGKSSNYKQLAAINNISNPNLIYIGQVIRLTNDAGGGSGGGSSSSTTVSSNKPTITQFGLLSTGTYTLFATWSWSKSNTNSYKVLWTYDTGNGVWLVGDSETINVDDDAPEMSRQSTYDVPSGAKKVRFKVKPISKSYTKNDTEVNYWDANWSDVQTYTDSTPIDTPEAPTVEIDKYKLTMSLDNVAIDADGIEFEVVKDNSAAPFKKGLKAELVTGYASQSCTIDVGSVYKARCRAYKGSEYSDWSQYSSNVGTIPAAPAGITVIRASSETSVYLEWAESTTATSYDIEYATKKDYFDGSDQTTVKSDIEYPHYDISGLESGSEYFFRVRGRNDDGTSAWSDSKSVVIGKDPAPPTTWSSTTTAIVGEPLNLYWVHNSEDGSSQTYAELELYIGELRETHTIENTRPEKEKDKTSVYTIDTSRYEEGIKILWRVRTAGVTKVYSDWSVQRTVDIYSPPTLELRMTDSDGNSLDTLTAFPFYISGVTSPKSQAPIGYHLTISANEIYETTDNMGKPMTVNKGDAVYSKYFDTFEALLVEFSASNVNLENNIHYLVSCTASMDSGLTAESELEFNVTWQDIQYEPNAEIGIDPDTLTASVRPYCEDRRLVTKLVDTSLGVYVLSDEEIPAVYGTVLPGAKTLTGEQVYYGTTADGEEVYYCFVEEVTPVTDVLLSVYRREFDGSFTELATGLDSAKHTTITDPHPALDYARYRIVAVSKTTGAVSYYDPPGYPVGGTAVIVQWDEDWTSFETSEENALEQPAWSGSLLKLPYNIDISDKHSSDVALIEYIGRSHPISYYGTQLGQSASWNMDVPKDDEETMYALRRLARWMGDVYVREPSGSGYWANVTVSFSQKHCEVTVPVTLELVRVEGGA